MNAAVQTDPGWVRNLGPDLGLDLGPRLGNGNANCPTMASLVPSIQPELVPGPSACGVDCHPTRGRTGARATLAPSLSRQRHPSRLQRQRGYPQKASQPKLLESSNF